MEINFSARVICLGIGMVALTSSAEAFSASFKWCGGTPAFSLKSVPKGTKKLEFEMTDLNVPSYRHGGGSVSYSGQKTIPCGAFDGNFVGPSPPPPQVHTYEFDIIARGAEGEALGKTKARRKFPE